VVLHWAASWEHVAVASGVCLSAGTGTYALECVGKRCYQLGVLRAAALVIDGAALVPCWAGNYLEERLGTAGLLDADVEAGVELLGVAVAHGEGAVRNDGCVAAGVEHAELAGGRVERAVACGLADKVASRWLPHSSAPGL
jgi:hypothetical protein